MLFFKKKIQQIQLLVSFFSVSTGSAISPSLHHQGQKEQIGLDFTTAVYILYNIYSILLVFVYIYLFSLFCIFEKINLKCQEKHLFVSWKEKSAGTATISSWFASQIAGNYVAITWVFHANDGPAGTGCCLTGHARRAFIDRSQPRVGIPTAQHLLHVSAVADLHGFCFSELLRGSLETNIGKNMRWLNGSSSSFPTRLFRPRVLSDSGMLLIWSMWLLHISHQTLYVVISNLMHFWPDWRSPTRAQRSELLVPSCYFDLWLKSVE